MITSINAFLKYFDGVNRRAIRDVGTLPPAAESWKPPAGSGENAWTIGELVAHMAASRLFFLNAYCGEGWHASAWPGAGHTRDAWVNALRESGSIMNERLAATPDDWLQRRVQSMDDSAQTISGWRVLMLGVEHDIHHRSQIDTYAGIEGWDVQQIYGRRAEDVGLSPQR